MQAHVNLASLLHRQLGNAEEAVLHYRKAISLYSNYCAARVNLGSLSCVVALQCKHDTHIALCKSALTIQSQALFSPTT